VPGQQREGAPLAINLPLGRPTHQHHEDRDERKRQRNRHPGHQVGLEHPAQHRSRHEAAQDQLRQVPGEVAVERIRALDGKRGELAAALLGQPARAEPHGVLE
jgi:hypothetical protein